MSTTTQILFNSPALHSLKREQLVKLCKIHSIKASGKNVELIQRLKQHAQSLPKDSPLSIAARSEDSPIQDQDQQTEAEGQEKEIDDDASSYQSSRPPRPSEQWEMVMDSIEEVEEGSSQGTLSSQRTLNNIGHTGEFGTGSSKSSTVSSSIKALATSLGLKRTHTNSKSTLSSTVSSKNTSVFPPPSIQESTPDELTQMSTPYSSLPEPPYPPQTDHFTFNEAGNRESTGGPAAPPDADSEVLPGHALRPGVPAPPNARLSLGLGLGATPATPSRKAQPTTTIRLVGNPLPSDNNQGPRAFNPSFGSGDFGTPQLKPFKTTFDITFGSPIPNNGGFGSPLTVWPPRGDDEDVPMRGIYPTLTFDDLPPTVEVKTTDMHSPSPTVTDDVPMPGSLMPDPASTLATPSKSRAPSIVPSPFVFGTPQHQVTDDQFRAAASAVLEEMNAKLREDGVDEIASDIITKLHPNAGKDKALLSPRQIRPLPGSKRGEISQKFDKMHEEEFQKMEGIDEVVRKRAERTSPSKKPAADEDQKVVVGKKRKSSVVERDGAPKRPSVLPGRASNTRVISAGRRAKSKVLPGGFDLGDEEDDSSEAEADLRGSKRTKMDPDFVPPTAEEEAQARVAEAEEAEKRRVLMEKEKEALKKKLEANRARRRSSALQGQGAGVLAPRKSGAGRASIGRPRHSVLIKPKPKPSKFGFLSSAKSLVQSVWNRGKVAAPAPAALASNIPKASSKADSTKEQEKATTKIAPSFMPSKKSALATAKSSASVATSNATAAGKTASTSKAGALGAPSSTMSSGRSRSPLPSFNSNGTLQSNGTSSATGTRTSSRISSMAGTGGSKMSSATNAQSGVSSIGTRLSRMSGMTNSSGTSGVGSMGTKSSESRTSTTGTRSSSRFSSTTSRLLAPTASSLAKMTARVGDHSAAGNAVKQALGSITNSPGLHSNRAARFHSPAPSATFSPKQIFSKPLTLGQPSPSGIPVAAPLKRRGHVRGSSQSSTNSTESAGENTKPKDPTSSTTASSAASITGSVRTRSLNGRKPRISRSKVIARLASQRENGSATTNRVASGSSLASNAAGSTTKSSLAPKVGRISAGGKTRSSLGAKVARPRTRASYAGGDKRLGVRTSSGASHDSVLMSAKKRARRSEYARRQSQRASAAGIGKLNLGTGEADGMEVE
ncbi:hypothetical protein CVT26_006662 [Gymnopilus dilepis]|uniref:SAP domain-containing protein n=1 Tax=Gymnopilus dilepis TaxID=231916 RepID=A0A409Y2N7_9AGAR|nr:hypothetical protein CVT26_006662 [Gymnopilus dilepis]